MLDNVKRSAKFLARSIQAGQSFSSIFSSQPPSAQGVVDLFKGDWAAGLPLPGVVSGNRPDLFKDPRIQWFLDHVGPKIRNASVLELGPLEGAHSTMLEKAGAQEVLGIEANGRAYLKCLAVKELLDLKRCRFLYGDFVKYMAEPGPTFDLGIACGVFYHLRDPHLALQSLRNRVNGPVFLWTHYWVPEIQNRFPTLWRNFNGQRTVEFNGHPVELHCHEYGTSVFAKGFFGGNARHSEWMEKESLLRTIESVGWRIVTSRDDSNEIGPAMSFILEPVE